MEKEIVTLKSNADQIKTEYQIIAINDNENDNNKNVSYIEQQIQLKQIKIDKINEDLKQFINTADGLDYTTAVISGILSGLIDSFFVGETEIDIDKIQNFLEEKYHTSNDSSYRHKDANGKWISSALYHRLDDLAHHPTLGGLIASILVRYFRLAIFIDGTDGKPHIFFDDTSNPDVFAKEKEKQIKAWIGAAIGGLCFWLANVAIKKYEEKNDDKLPEPLKKMIKLIGASPITIEVLKCVDIWLGHMMSDVSTSQGIPGVILSLMKEISVLPILRNTDFSVKVDGYYNKGEKNLSEWGGVAFVAAKKQSLPVLINETFIRMFYFIRRLTTELKNNKDVKSVNWDNVIPLKNRTIVRMMTIATGTFTAVDIADAAIRAAAKSGGNPAIIATNLILRVNFIGIGRFAIALGADIGMGAKKRSLERQVLVYYNDTIALANGSPLMFRSDTKWITLDGKETTFGEALSHATTNVRFYMVSANAAIATASENISDFADTVVSGQQELKERLNSLANVKEKMNCNKYNEEN